MGNAMWEGVEQGGLGLRGFRTIVGDEDGDWEVMVAEESLGELDEWDEMSQAWTWHHGH